MPFCWVSHEAAHLSLAATKCNGMCYQQVLRFALSDQNNCWQHEEGLCNWLPDDVTSQTAGDARSKS